MKTLLTLTQIKLGVLALLDSDDPAKVRRGERAQALLRAGYTVKAEQVLVESYSA